jgi:predicted HicB family RNase H-like nuclease
MPILPMAKTATLNLRVSADFKRRLMEEAAKEKRSVTNYVEVSLTRYWETTHLDVLEERKKKNRRD